jgi:DNA repair protein RecO (recombination protein O)
MTDRPPPEASNVTPGHFTRPDTPLPQPPGFFAGDGIPQGLVRQSGVVLRREISAEGNVSLYLFLKEIGPVWISAPGASRGRIRFGGAIEPLVWANFNLYKGTKRFYLKSVDIKEDFWALRADPEKIRTMLEWDRMLCRHLVPGLPCDEVLAIFYWSGMLLKEGVSPAVAEWRFLWKWLNSWGIAPSLDFCSGCGAPLSDARLSASGLLCPACYRRNEGTLLPEKALVLMRKAVGSPVNRMGELFPAEVFPGGSLWEDANCRLRLFFNAMQ